MLISCQSVYKCHWYSHFSLRIWDTPDFHICVHKSYNLCEGCPHMPVSVKHHCAAADNLSSGCPQSPENVNRHILLHVHKCCGDPQQYAAVVSVIIFPVYGHIQPKVVTISILMWMWKPESWDWSSQFKVWEMFTLKAFDVRMYENFILDTNHDASVHESHQWARFPHNYVAMWRGIFCSPVKTLDMN